MMKIQYVIAMDKESAHRHFETVEYIFNDALQAIKAGNYEYATSAYTCGIALLSFVHGHAPLQVSEDEE